MPGRSTLAEGKKTYENYNSWGRFAAPKFAPSVRSCVLVSFACFLASGSNNIIVFRNTWPKKRSHMDHHLHECCKGGGDSHIQKCAEYQNVRSIFTECQSCRRVQCNACWLGSTYRCMRCGEMLCLEGRGDMMTHWLSMPMSSSSARIT